MRKALYLLVVSFLLVISSNQITAAQTINNDKVSKRFYVDYTAGPYLFIDHIRYNSVFLQGARLGYYFKSNISLAIEYSAGQQEDDQNTLGMTHQANLKGNYFLATTTARFRPYLHVGGGFLEFKDFVDDEYGFSYFTGFGSETSFSEFIKGILEFRYLSTSAFEVEGKNQIGVFWGLRLKF